MQSKLWDAVCRGEVDTVGSDHSPCPPSMKQGENFAAAWGGISGVQHSLPLLVDGLLQREQALSRAVELVSSKPAALFGLAGEVGTLEVGQAADLCQLRAAKHTVERSDLLDRHRHSPYVAKAMYHHVVTTWVDGQVVHALSKS